jgi:hypothetical protein
MIRGVLFGSSKASSEDHSDTGTVATMDMSSLDMLRSYSDRSLSMEISCLVSPAATCGATTTFNVVSPLEEQEQSPHRFISLEETKVHEEEEEEEEDARHEQSIPQVLPRAIMPIQDALEWSSDPSCQPETIRSSSEPSLPPLAASSYKAVNVCSSRRAVSYSTLEPVREEDLIREQQDMHAIMALMNKSMGFQPKQITPLKVMPIATITPKHGTLPSIGNGNLLSTMEHEMSDMLMAMKQCMGIKAIETTVVPTRKEPQESSVEMAATVAQDDAETNPTLMLSSEFEERKNIMPTLQKSIGFKPVDIQRCSDQSNSTTTAPEDSAKETATTESVDAIRLSNEFDEMHDIMATLRKSIGFHPVEITGMQSFTSHKPDGYQHIASPLKRSSNAPYLSLSMDNDDDSVDSRYHLEEEEDSEDDDDSVNDTKRYRTVIKALDKAIRTTEDRDDDESPSSTKPEPPRRSLLPGRPETVMSSDIRDLLRQEAIINTISDKVDPQDLNQEVNPAILAYVNRRKAVEEHSMLIEIEHGRVQQRLADLKAKRLARFRAKKAAAGAQATRSK